MSMLWVRLKEVESGENFPLVERYVYNTNGQLTNQTVAGFSTSYTYHPNGELYQRIDGQNKDARFFNYRRGIAQDVLDREGQLTQREVDVYGNTTSETDPNNVLRRYSYYQQDYAKRLSRVNFNAAGETYYTDQTFTYAQFMESDKFDTYKTERQVVANKLSRTTRYDSLGRVLWLVEQDLAGTNETRIRRFAYDRLGRLVFKGDPRHDFALTHGTHFEYDSYGRVKKMKHPLADSPAVEYCYGQNCGTSFSLAGPVTDGYVVKDQAGYISVYNYRALGTSANKELVEIRQEIRPNAFSAIRNETNDNVVVTRINRNLVGFINSVVQQGDSGSPSFERSYIPFATAGSTTFLVKSETHPEFGTKTVDQFDLNGNVLKSKNFNGAETSYVYDSMERLRFQLNPGDINDTAGVPNTEYQYRNNGTLASVVHGSRRWDYTYNNVNMLATETLSIDDEQFVLRYDHNAAAQVRAVTYPGNRVVYTAKNGFGQATSIAGFADDISYHANGMLAVVEFENGTRFSSEMDDYQRPSVWRTEDISGSAYFHFRYLYDSRSNVTGINNYFPPNVGALTNVMYDGLNRLVRADADEIWGIGQYAYDPIGNIRTMHVGGNNRSFYYDQTNKLQSVVSTQALVSYNMDYDANGNVISTGASEYDFDQLNRLLRSDDGTAILENTYDGLNMRAKGRTIRDGNVSTTYYIYNREGQLLHELDLETGETRDHIQLNGRTIATMGANSLVDTDNDGMPDYFERLHGFDRYVDDAALDDDNDGISNVLEYQYKLLPTNSDSDHDGIPDGEDPDTPPGALASSKRKVDMTPILDFLMD